MKTSWLNGAFCFGGALLLAAVFGYLAIQYLRYLLHKEKFNLFSYYCWDAVAIALIVALINA